MNFLEEDIILIDTQVDAPSERDLQFLDLTGRKTYWSQGFKGKGIVVAVVDTGVSPHEEFGNRLLKGRNFSTDHNGDPNITIDIFGHGSHCAGSIAGKSVGIMPESEILPVKVLNGTGGGTFGTVLAGLQYCIDWKHPITGKKLNAVSMSLSFPTLTSIELANLRGAVQTLNQSGIAVFASAGNTGKEEMRYPAALDEVVCVGAVDIEKKQAYFTTQGNHVDVCNIGVNVLSVCNTGGYIRMSGTSMSTPLSCGLAGLIAEKYESIYGKRIDEYLWYEMVKMHTKDLGIRGVDKIHGTGFFTLQPLEMEMNVQVGSNVIRVNGENHVMETPAQIINGRFMVPVRFVTDPAGAYVTWSEDSKGYTTGARVVF
jgi:major intracellular serine protease